MALEWYLVLSALLFAVGAGGALRRSPLVILLCLELMLNAGNPRRWRSRACSATRTVRCSRSS